MDYPSPPPFAPPPSPTHAKSTSLFLKIIMFCALAVTILTGLFFAHIWIYKVRRLRISQTEENEEERGFTARGLRNRRFRLGETINFLTDLRLYILRGRLLSTLHTRYRDATRAELEPPNDICAICLELMEAGDYYSQKSTRTAWRPKMLLCKHTFHIHCLRNWLDKEFSCPTCRASVWDGRQQALSNLSHDEVAAIVVRLSRNSDYDVDPATVTQSRDSPDPAAALPTITTTTTRTNALEDGIVDRSTAADVDDEEEEDEDGVIEAALAALATSTATTADEQQQQQQQQQQDDGSGKTPSF